MPSYMTRVVLHGAADDRKIYEDLHQYMAEAGFSKVIQDAKGVWELPEAMYNFSAGDDKITLNGVRQKAKDAADRTKKQNTVLTLRYDNWASTGLTPASES